MLPELSKKFSQITLLLCSIVALIIGLLALAAVSNLVLLFLVTAVVSFGFGIQYVTFSTLISLNTPQTSQGGALGIAWAIAGLAQTVAPVLAAAVFSFGASLGFVGLAFTASALISLVTVPLVLIFKKIT